MAVERQRIPPKRASLFTRISEDSKKSKAAMLVLSGLVIVLFAIIMVMIATEEPKAEVAEVGETLTLRDGGLGQIWLPALAGVEKNTYDQAAFGKDGEFTTYAGAPRTALRGIDVSAHQGEIDWQKVKAEGVQFAMLRVGYRGYGNGQIVIDEWFHRNAEEAAKVGIDIGAYFFSQAVSVEEAEEEANVVLTEIAAHRIDYPVVFDWEVVGAENARTNTIDPATLNNCAIAYCKTVAAAGYQPMIYASQRLALLKYDLSLLTDYDLWLAEYNATPRFYYNFQIWQYTETGVVDGINGKTDLNLCFVKY